MSAARRFVAIGVPETVRIGLEGEIAAVLAGQPALRPTRPEGWHVTLAFCGEVDDRSLETLLAAVTDGVGRWVSRTDDVALRLALGAPGTFGNRVLYLGVEDEPAGGLVALATAVRAAIAGRGLPVADAPMRPHVTLARTRRRTATSATAAACRELARRVAACDGAVGWTVPTVGVWRAWLGSGPARYTEEVPVELGASG